MEFRTTYNDCQVVIQISSVTILSITRKKCTFFLVYIESTAFLLLFEQKDDVVMVTGPVAASLKCSRFSDEFEYQPAPKESCGSPCNGSTCDKVSQLYRLKLVE